MTVGLRSNGAWKSNGKHVTAISKGSLKKKVAGWIRNLEFARNENLLLRVEVGFTSMGAAAKFHSSAFIYMEDGFTSMTVNVTSIFTSSSEANGSSHGNKLKNQPCRRPGVRSATVVGVRQSNAQVNIMSTERKPSRPSVAPHWLCSVCDRGTGGDAYSAFSLLPGSSERVSTHRAGLV